MANNRWPLLIAGVEAEIITSMEKEAAASSTLDKFQPRIPPRARMRTKCRDRQELISKMPTEEALAKLVASGLQLRAGVLKLVLVLFS